MKRKLLMTTLIVAFAKITFAQFTTGNLVVARIGDGTTYNTGVSRPVSLVEYTIAGAVVGSAVNLNTTPAGSRLTLNDNAGTEGMLALSSDRVFLSLGGYDSATGVAAATVFGTTTTKVIARINSLKTVDYTTKILAGDFASNFREALSVDGTNFWFTSASGGVRYVPFGNSSTTTSTAVAQSNGNYTNARGLGIYGGQLYCSFFNTANYGLSSIGTGSPTTTATPTALTGFTKNVANGDFVFFDLDATVSGVDVAYITEGATLKKYSLVAGTWTQNSSIALTNTSFGLTGITNAAGKVFLFFTVGGPTTGTPTSGVGENNTLETISDINGYNAVSSSTTTTVLASAGTGYAFRGVSFTPNSPVVLPVSLNNFNGKTTADGIQLNWATSSENNNDRFEVLRSDDATNFQTITSVKGSGTSTQTNNYAYLDSKPTGGVNYYQLNQVDLDGKATLSNVVAVNFGLKDSEVNIYANATDLTFNIKALKGGNAIISVYNVNGAEVLTKSIAVDAGLNTKNINITGLQQGVYVAKLNFENKLSTKKFIK